MRELEKRKEYQGGHAMGHLEVLFPVLVKLLGEPYRNDPIGENPNYPDDDEKTDVCWCVEDVAGNFLNIWNYKNGPAYGDAEEGLTVEKIDYFSYFCECPALVDELVKAIETETGAYSLRKSSFALTIDGRARRSRSLQPKVNRLRERERVMADGKTKEIVEQFATAEEIQAARDLYQTDEVEIDDGAKVSDAREDCGRWVAAWVWVSDSDLGIEC